MKDFIPPNLPLSLLQGALLASHGLSGEWHPMQGERDQNFRVTTADGAAYVFKVCNPHEGRAIAECHAAALAHIAVVDPELAIPLLHRSTTGQSLSQVVAGGQTHDIMLLSYLPGEVIGETELPAQRYHEIGRMVARLGLALRGFIHPGPASRRLIWDTRFACNLAGQVKHLPPADQPAAQAILDHHRDVTTPRLMQFRTQIIHGDVHPYNMLAGPAGDITGIIDFGDIVHAPLVQDIANALADFLFPGHDIACTIFEFIRGYTSLTAIEEAEADVILDLAAVRLLMTALVQGMKETAEIGSFGYLEEFTGRVMPLLADLRGPRRMELRNLVRRAAAFPPKPEPPAAMDLIARRKKTMGSKPYVFYDPPVHMVRGEGVWLFDSAGRRYLDCYNNVPHVGHCHPYVTEAIVRQARRLNTNTRYITEEPVTYAERLLALSHGSLGAVIFVNSGSEANDLAWRMAKAWTGHHGGLAMDFAYHGVTEATDAFSPSNAPQAWSAPHIRLLPPPDVYRGPWKHGDNDLAQRYAGLADSPIAELKQPGLGVAAVMIDSAFMTNGILDAPTGYLRAVTSKVRDAGGLFIADEVQSGFGRMGTAFWGHQHHGVVPDIITIGKPAGNGHPVGAVITRTEILDHFTRYGPFFSTFGGNNVACAAGIAVLDVIRDENLVENARTAGEYLRAGVRRLMAQHDIIGDVRGVGLATGVELVRNRRTQEPAGHETNRLLGLLRDEGVLIGGEGKSGNVLKIRPPIIFSRDHADIAVDAIGRALAQL